jgi:VanZ family protein
LTPEQKEVLKVWIAAGLWLVLIAIESSNLLSAANTGRILYPILHFLFGITRAQFPIWHFYIRKTGHFVGYFVLSALLFRAWRLTLPTRNPGVWAMRWATVAFFMSVLVASLDEWHQSFLSSRTAEVSDVVLDSCAALVAQLVMFWFYSRNRVTMNPAD